jgi:hypothetical protein
MSMSYILPIMDGATGTIPLTHQHSVMSLLTTDAPHFIRAIPRMISSLASALARRRNKLIWRELREVGLYLLLSVIELQLALAAVPLWLMGPGFLVLPLFCAQIGIIWYLIRLINRGRRVFKYASELSKGANQGRGDHNRWTVVGGMEWSEDYLRTQTIPRLSKLFGHDIQVFLPYRLGVPLDFLTRVLQRTLQLPTPTSTALYNHVRANCVKSHANQMNILVHNTGALDMAWVMSRLCSDLPPGQQLGKFHVYTFGAATAEMTMPLGSRNAHAGHTCNCESVPEYPLVDHFAFEDDPFAQIGVLTGARQRMEGRFVGAVYAIQQHTPVRSRASFLQGGKCSLDDYLDALFPNGDPRAGVLGQVCRIERDVSEMRELSALAKAVQEQTQKGKRISWTALGALADSTSHFRIERNEMAGVISLEEARRIGKASEGMLGYENNTLAGCVRGEYGLTQEELRGRRIEAKDRACIRVVSN